MIVSASKIPNINKNSGDNSFCVGKCDDIGAELFLESGSGCRGGSDVITGGDLSAPDVSR
jgi:hypothetical protein